METIYLQLGSNQGHSLGNLDAAKLQLQKLGKIESLSSIYVTQAWGNLNQDDYLNQVIELRTDLSPADLLRQVKEIEGKLGRMKNEKWGPRMIDIDILFYGSEIVESSELTIPHLHMRDRKFVLVPLNEIASNFIHPVLNVSVNELLRNCSDPLSVEKLET